MSTCDTCQYCYQQSNHNKGAKIHTIHYRCHLIEKAVNPYNSCEMWKERKGKMKTRYKDGYVDEVAVEMVCNEPTEPIIRCKDCKHWFYFWESEKHHCTESDKHPWDCPIREEDDFCSRGVKR